MRKFKTENILPEGQRPLEVRDCETGVIGGNDAKWRSADWISANVQPAYAESFGVASAHLSRRSEREGGTSNVEFRRWIGRSVVRCLFYSASPTLILPSSKGLLDRPNLRESA
jgi:hypothetical protein